MKETVVESSEDAGPEASWQQSPASTTDWRRGDLLPAYSGDTWCVWDRGRTQTCDEREVRRRLKRWQTQSRLLVAAPGASRFDVPTSIAAVAQTARSELRRQTLLQVGVCTAVALLGWVQFSLVSSRSALALAISFTLFACALLADHAGPLRDTGTIDARVRFMYWLFSSPARVTGIVIWTLIPSMAGLAQYLAMRELGGQAASFYAYGVMYDDVHAGEYWRLISGPFLHYTLLHFVNNYFLLILIGTLSTVLLGVRTPLLVFLAGNSIGAIGQMLLGGSAYDSCGGLSFGINALFGLVIVSAVLDKRMLPRGMPLLIGTIAVAGVVSGEAASATTATAGHVAGLASGALCAVLRHRFTVHAATRLIT